MARKKKRQNRPTPKMIALYHFLLEHFPSLETGACSLGVPCEIVWFKEFGFVTLPYMALSGFVLIAVILVLVLGLVAIIWNLAIVRGAGRMRACRNYRLAVTAAVLSFLPLPLYYCLPISAPVAVWAFITLLRRDVRARFAAVARDTMNPAPPEAPDARRPDPA